MATVKYGLLGHPLGHSFSRRFHNQRFEAMGIDAEYENYDLEQVEQILVVMQAEPTLQGLNVTIPYKQAIMPYLDELDPMAAKIGAVNTVKIARTLNAQGETQLHLKGYNTDIIGFTNSLKPMLQQAGLKTEAALAPGETQGGALVLGTGGASKAIFVALQQLGIEPLYVSRTEGPNRITYAQLTPEVMATHRVIVNCTPLGMHPNVETCPDIPYQALTPQHVCFDCVYNPAETLFMKRAAAQGAQVKCGHEMLEGQAIASYEIWTQP